MRKLKSKKISVIFITMTCVVIITSLICYRYVFIRPNIILIVIDALRADHLGCYGYQRNTSPNIDSLAKKGVVFTQAITAAGWTWESVPSILTGSYFLTRQAGNKDWDSTRNPGIDTIVKPLKLKGYRAALFTNQTAIKAIDVLDGFDEIFISELAKTGEHRLTVKVIDWLSQKKDRPFFVYLHYLGTHIPYNPPEPYKSRYILDKFRVAKELPISKDEKLGNNGFRKIPFKVVQNNISDASYYISQYDGMIGFMDSQIGYLIRHLESLGLVKNTAVIITADHGEHLGEHDIYFDHAACYEENIRVPLLVIFPKLFPRGEVVSRLVSSIDIAPTILDIAKIHIPSHVDGKSILPLFKNNKLDAHSYVYISAPGYFGLQSSVRNESWKLIKSGKSSYELYNLHNDPGELNNLIDKEQIKFEEMKKVLDSYGKKYFILRKERMEYLTNEQKEILRNLGYLQ